jgi:5-formyltetrahydrofolate cyclo-ligase
MGDKRASLLPDQVEANSRLISSKLNVLEPLVNARSIMGFANIGNEVDLSFFLEEQADQGKTILLPRMEPQGALAAIEFTGWQHTRPGAFKIREPLGPEISAADIDAVIVPGLVFDGHGYRLGYGKGYYDRFLEGLSNKTFVCGVCYDFQVVDNVCPHAGDIPVHWIVTEKSELAINWDFF